MNNADMPAMPIVNEFGHPYHAGDIAFSNKPLTFGLTKREQFAMAAMQGLLSGGVNSVNPKVRTTDLISESYCIADAMLEEKQTC